MFQLFKFTKSLSFIVSVIVISAVLSYAVLAWTEPIFAPPAGNFSAPINVSNTGQSKAGGLILNTGGAANGLIVQNGNVGIGTNNPTSQLYISGAGEIKLQSTSNPNYADIHLDNSLIAGGREYVMGNYGPVVAFSTPNSFFIRDNNTGIDRLIIIPSGNVGIGTNNPTTGKLVVSGGNVDISNNKVINVAAPTTATDAATKGYVDAATGSPACSDNYANLCSNGGGLAFIYNGRTLHIDAFPRSYVGEYAGANGMPGLGSRSCEIIGARLPTLSEWAAACNALSGPNGNGETSFGGSAAGRWEWTATPGSIYDINGVTMMAGAGSCSGSSTSGGYVAGYGWTPWFRCVR